MPQSNKQTGSTLGGVLLASVIIVVLLGLAILRLRSGAATHHDGSTVVRIYCAAGMVKPIEQLIEGYQRTHQSHVEIVRTGGSGELFGQIKTEFATGMERGADIFVSADDVLLSIVANKRIVS